MGVGLYFPDVGLTWEELLSDSANYIHMVDLFCGEFLPGRVSYVQNVDYVLLTVVYRCSATATSTTRVSMIGAVLKHLTSIVKIHEWHDLLAKLVSEYGDGVSWQKLKPASLEPEARESKAQTPQHEPDILEPWVWSLQGNCIGT